MTTTDEPPDKQAWPILCAQVPPDVAQAIDRIAGERGVSRSQAICDLLEPAVRRLAA